MTDRREILNTAASLIGGERRRDYGSAGDNFARIGNLWAEILGVPVTAVQVALCMAQVKVARLCSSPDHLDSWVDAAGYLALGGEIATDEVAQSFRGLVVPRVVNQLDEGERDARWRDCEGDNWYWVNDGDGIGYCCEGDVARDRIGAGWGPYTEVIK